MEKLGDRRDGPGPARSCFLVLVRVWPLHHITSREVDSRIMRNRNRGPGPGPERGAGAGAGLRVPSKVQFSAETERERKRASIFYLEDNVTKRETVIYTEQKGYIYQVYTV